MSISLIIKSPSQQVNDIKVDGQLLWSIGKLKEHLSSTYPTHPRKEDQRLIYGGRLLLDHLLIKDVINWNQDVHTMHIMCPTVNLTENVPSFKVENQVNSPGVFYTPPVLSNLQTDGLRQRIADPQQTPRNYFPYQQYSFPQVGSVPSDLSITPGNAAYQMAAMQQVYTQLMAQYFTQARVGAQNFQHGTALSTPEIPSARSVMDTPPQPAANALPAANVPEQRVQNNANREDAEGRDLLDWIYIGSRILMLAMVLYFYSSVHRIMLVVSLCLMLFVYRVHFERLQGRRTPPMQRQANDPSARENPSREGERNAGSDHSETASRETTSSNQDDDSQSGENSEPEREAVPVQESQNSIHSMMSVALTFVITFFTSLIPEQPVPININ